MNRIFVFIMMIMLQCSILMTVAQETEEVLAYCNDEMQAKGFGSAKDINIEVGIFLPQIVNYEGNDITKVKIGLKNKVSNVTIFIRESLDEEPVYTQTVGSMNDGWSEINLNQRFKITDKPLYIGYSCSLKGGAYELGIATNEPCENSFFMDSGSGFKDMSEKGNKPLSMKVVIAGNNFIYDTAEISCVNHTYVRPEEGIPVTFDIRNIGMNEITSVEAEISIDGTEQVLPLKLENISIARKDILKGKKLDFKSLPEGTYNVKCKMISANGKPLDTEKVFEQRIYVLSESMPKKPVCEKITGNYCQFCPKGIVAFERMFDKYPETFIGISADCYSESDPLYIGDYLPLALNFSGSAPAFVIDRKWVSKEFEILERDYDNACKQLAWAELDVSAPYETYNDKKIDVTVRTTFNIDQSETHYRLILVAIENNVRAFQINGYSGNGYGEMGGWEKLPSRVDTLFNEVARRIVNYNGIENSIPSNVTKGETYEFNYTMDIPKVGDIDNTEIVAMLMNTENGQIVNSAKVKVASGSGIKSQEKEIPEYTIEDGNIHIRFNQNAKYTVSLYSIDGQKKLEMMSDGKSLQLPTTGIKGIYIMVISQNNEIRAREKVLL